MKLLESLNKYKGIILICIGFSIRILMLLYYYYTHCIDPLRSWGDVGLNFRNIIYYPLLTTWFLEIFVLISFGSIEIFAFWAFFWELFTSILFYFVLKRFEIERIKFIYGLYLLNPFLFLNNVFSSINCGYHITDSFFFLFFFLALIFYPKKGDDNKYLFFIFLGFSMVSKYYTLPALGFLFIKMLYDKNWKDIKQLILTISPILAGFFLIPLLIAPKYGNELMQWYQIGSETPFYLRIIPAIIILALFLVFRIKKADLLEIIIVFSIMAMGTFMFFSYPYLRWFQSIIFFGILKSKTFYTLNLNLKFVQFKIKIDNNILTFLLSFLGVLLSYLMIIFILNPGFV